MSESTFGSLLAIIVLHWLIFGLQTEAQWHKILVALHMNFGFAPYLAVLIFCCARYQNAFTRLMTSRTLLVCGEASYSLYLLHLLIIEHFRPPQLYPLTWHIMLIALTNLIIVIATCIGLSLVSWTVIEVPARRWLRKSMGMATHRTMPTL